MTNSESIQNDLDKAIEDTKSLLNTFQNLKIITESNYNNKFFEYLDKSSIIQFILPFLEMKDMFQFRLTCRLINTTICSMSNMILYVKKLKQSIKKENKPKKIDLNLLSAQVENEEDLKIQVQTLKNVNEFLKQKLFESEKVIKIRGNDIEILKNESKSQEEMIMRLNETLEKSNEEQEETKKTNIILKQQLEDSKKKYDEYVENNVKNTDNLKNEIKQLKSDKNKLGEAVIKFKKASEELKRKNISKAEVLKAIKNFFMNSTLIKLKEIKGFEDVKNETNKETQNINQ
jgi:hypothetical protein